MDILKEYPDLLKLNSTTRAEFIKNLSRRNFDESSVRNLLSDILYEIEKVIISGDIDSLKSLSCFIKDISNAVDDEVVLRRWYQDSDNPFQRGNVVILICKHNNAELLEYLFSNECTHLGNLVFKFGDHSIIPTEEDGEQHNAFYYAIRSNNISLLDILVHKWPNNYFVKNKGKLEELLSSTYRELKLKNILLKDEMQVFVENILIDLRFFYKSSEPIPVTSAPTINSRIQLLSDSIKKLEIYSTAAEVDEKFIFLIKFIARNIFILKKQLKCTYATLPWEEIEFCLIAFVNLQTTTEEINLIYSSVLNKRKIVNYLVQFSDCIKKEFNNVKNFKLENLPVYPQLPRKTINTNIAKKFPLFQDLYTDYKSIRDINSLETIKKYIELSLYVDCTNKEGQLIIVRTLQVIGEYFKNTVETPKLSNHTCEMLLSLLPGGTRQIIIDLRDSLSHAYSLEKRLQIESNVDVNFYKNIQIDVKKINSVITEILFRNKICVIKLLLERITKSESAEDIKEICKMLELSIVRCGFNIGNVVDELTEIENLVKEFRDKIKDKTEYEEALLKNVDRVINFEKNKRIKLKTNYISGLLCCSIFVKNFQNFVMDKNSIKKLKCRTYEVLQKLSSEVKSENLKNIAHDFIDLYNMLVCRIDMGLQEELRRITFKVFMLVELQVGNMKWITELRDKLTTKEKNNCDTSACYYEKIYTKEIQMQHLVTKVSFLECALRKHRLHARIIENFTIYKNDKKLQVIIEMLLLDIMSILEGSNKMLTNNLLFLDEDSPSLIGRNLRNHLAHGNALLDILQNDTLFAIIINANKIISSNIEQQVKIGKLVRNNPFKVKSRFDQELTKIDIQKSLFDALIEGNFEGMEKSIKEGADVHARSLNLWTALHFASQGDNVKIVKFLLDQNLDVNAVDKKGQTPFHIAARCGCKSTVQLLLKKKIDIEVKDLNRKTSLHLAAQNGQTDVILVLLKNKACRDSNDSLGCTPLFYAVSNDHMEATKVLIRKQDIDAEVMFGGFTAVHVAARYGHSKLTVLLLLNKANANAKTDQQATPLHIASIDGCLEIVKNLVLFGAQINAKSSVGSTPLHCAVTNEHKMIVEFLLNLGADVNSVDGSNYTPLNCAAANGNLEIIKILIDKGIEIDHRTVKGLTSLYIAAQNGHLNAVKFLMEKNTSLNVRNIDGSSILHVAALNGHTEIVKLLVENGAKVNSKDAYNQTPLHFAAKNNQFEVAEALIALGANIDSEDKSGSTALLLSCQNKHQAVVKVLISHGANVKVQNKTTFLPLYESIAGGSIEIVKLLIKGGADMNSVDSLDRRPLHISAQFGNVEILKIILKLNCNINIKCQFGFTPLHFAVLGNHMEAYKLLIKSGAKVNVKNSSDETPLCYAVKNNFKEIVVDLIERGADINIGYPLYLAILPGFTDIAQVFIHTERFNANIVNPSKMTPLHVAAFCGQEDVVSALIVKGADVNATSKDTLTALHYAALNGHNEVINLLLKSGAKLNERTIEGYTPVSVAASKGHTNVVTTLLDHGADPSIADIRNRNSVQQAVSEDKLKVVEILLKLDSVNVNEKGEEDFTLLHIAAQEGHLDMTKLLIQKGADINAKSQGAKPIHVAARRGQLNIVKFYLGGKINLGDLTSAGETLLHYAVVSGNTEMVKYLITQQMDINVSATNGAKPIHIAACEGLEEVIHILIDNGAYFDTHFANHGTALELSKFYNKEKVTKLLILIRNFFKAVKCNNVSETKKFLEEGAIVNVKSSAEVTPLHYASWKGYGNIVKLLLKNKANPNVIGKNGCTPLHYATKFNHIDIVKTLLLHKAGYNIACNNKKTPLDFATHPEIAKLFNLIDESFRSVLNCNSEIFSKLNQLKDKNTLKIVMNACNKDNRTLITVGIHSDFPQMERLKQVLPDGMSIEVNVAYELCMQERYEKALPLYKSAHEKRKELFGIDNPYTLEMQFIIGKVLSAQQKIVEALKVLEDVHQKQKVVLGADNIVTLETKLAIAVILHRQGKNEKALSMYMEVLPKQIEILGGNHSKVLTTRTEIAVVLCVLSKFEEAQSINYELLEIYKIKEGPDHPKTLTVQNSIAKTLGLQGKFHESLELNKVVYKAMKKILGPNHSQTLHVLQDIAIALSNINKSNPSTEMLEEILKHEIKAFGTEHYDTLFTQYTIANIVLLQGNISKSLEMYLSIFDRIKAILGPHHDIVVDIDKKIKAIQDSISCQS